MTQAPSVESLMAQVADEFLDRLARGEAPAVEEYAERYPQIAGFIRQMFPTLAVLRDGNAEPAVDGPDGPRRLGDFRILREVGRGGMGVVYEAEQISLGRRVALKVLPFASALDQRQLQRFKTEAQAAGQLHHTHIVPVYFVGEDRGVHFYAMQFIDGRTVAELIAELRGDAEPVPAGESTPPRNALSTLRSGRKPEYYRWVAECGVQAAEALEHAHAHGVVHRDIKPANLIRDHAGQVWVTDFGLAQVRTDVRLTATGDVVGTLRYMSPEQAFRPGQVDHRSDVYSLGVTLYEMLTLRAAFPAELREELVKQIADRDPPSARTIDRSIPSELDVIVRKAMAKEPDERYATAKDFADDLRRFMDHRPILAKRPTLVQTTRKWMRRHRQIVTTAILGVIVSLVGSTGTLFAMLAEVRGANTQLTKEVAERKAAQEEERAAKEQERLAKEREKEKAELAAKNADRAETNFGEYQRAMIRLLEKGRWEYPSALEVMRARRELCEEIVRLLNDLPDDPATTSNVQGLLAIALSQEALGAFMLGAGKRAEAAFAQSEKLFEAIIAADPQDAVYRSSFSWMLTYRAMTLVLDDRIDAANTYWDRSVEQARIGLAFSPRDEQCRLALSETISLIENARAKGVTIRRKETLADALVLMEGLCEDAPKADYIFRRARLRGGIGFARLRTDPATGVAEILAAIPEVRALSAADPFNLKYHEELVTRLGAAGGALYRLKQPHESEKAYREAVKHASELTRLNPATAPERLNFARIASSLAIVLGPTGPKADEASDLLQSAVRSLEIALLIEASKPGQDMLRAELFNRAVQLTQSLTSLNRTPDAAEALGRAARNEGADAKNPVQVAAQYATLAQKVTADQNFPPAQKPAAVANYNSLALTALGRAKGRGYQTWEKVRDHTAFAGLKDTDEFKAITAGK